MSINLLSIKLRNKTVSPFISRLANSLSLFSVDILGFQHYEIIPDLICCGKGMGGGVALSGVIGKKKIMDLPEVGNMSSTHSANPIACSA